MVEEVGQVIIDSDIERLRARQNAERDAARVATAKHLSELEAMGFIWGPASAPDPWVVLADEIRGMSK